MEWFPKAVGLELIEELPSVTLSFQNSSIKNGQLEKMFDCATSRIVEKYDMELDVMSYTIRPVSEN
ncbi:MAG: hypothetical protein ACW960_15725, partial [Candidatus Thorarchaeota archaeon]